MKLSLSKETIKRIILVIIVVGLFEIYSAAKKHSNSKVKESQNTAYVPQDLDRKNEWFKSEYANQIKSCIPEISDFKKDDQLTKFSYLYQSQLHNVKLNFPNASLKDQEITAKNQFLTAINLHIEEYAADHFSKSDAKNYQRIVLSESLSNGLKTTEVSNILLNISTENNSQNIANKDQLVENRNDKEVGSLVVIKLLQSQFNRDEISTENKDKCFSILENHPSV
jgi:hypothetical protein